MKRDDFDENTKRTLEYRVNCKCSNPNCKRPTSGPKLSVNGFVRSGEAAHICAASPGGKRYAPDMTKEERMSISNGIWLCRNCHKLVDSDEQRYTVAVLRSWKAIAEEEARIMQAAGLQNPTLPSSSPTPTRFIRISIILFLLITICLAPVIVVYVSGVQVGFWGRLLYYLSLIVIARISLNEIETRPNIAASCFGTISEDDLLLMPKVLYNKIAGCFGPSIFLSEHKEPPFTSYYVLKRLEFGTWDNMCINYLKVVFRTALEWYDPSVLYIHSLSRNRQAVQMLIRQGFILQPPYRPELKHADYLTKNDLHIFLFHHKKKIDYMVIFQCDEDTLNQHLDRFGM